MLPKQPSDLTRKLEQRFSRRRGAVALCVANVVLGLALSLIAWPNCAPITPDSTSYLEGARSLVRHGEYTHIDGAPLVLYPPGYSLLIAWTRPLTGSLVTAGRLICLVMSTASIPLVFFLIRPFGSALVAGGTMTLFAMLPERVEHSVMVWSDAPFLFILLVLLLLVYRWLRTDRILWAALAGVAAGAAYMIRPEGAILLGIVLVTALVVSRLRRRVVLGAVVATVCFALAASPYVRYLHEHTGTWQLSMKTKISFMIADEVTFGKGWRSFITLDEYGKIDLPQPEMRPAHLLKRYFYNGAKMLLRMARTATPVPCLLAGLGIISMIFHWRFRPFPPEAICFLVALISPMVYLPVLWVESRYLIQPAIPLLAFGVAGAVHILDLVPAAATKHVAEGLGACFLITMLAFNVPNSVGRGMATYESVHEHARWITRNRPDAEAIVARDWHLAYEAELVILPLPYAPVDGVIQFARDHGVSLILLPKENAYPSLSALALHPKPTKGLTPIQYWENSVLFELEDVPDRDAAPAAWHRGARGDASAFWTRFR